MWTFCDNCILCYTLTGSCGGKADIFFVLDASGSISGPDFKTQLAFVSNVVSQFDISPQTIRIGVLTFGDNSRYEIDITLPTEKEALLAAITSIHQSRGGTRTDGALLRTRGLLSRHGRIEVPKLVIVMTDGQSEYPDITAQEARLLHEDAITTFAIGIGHSVDHTELRNIASRPEYVFEVDSFDVLETIRELLTNKACEGVYFTINYYS